MCRAEWRARYVVGRRTSPSECNRVALDFICRLTDLVRYKARPVFESMLSYLDERHAEQVETGVVSANN